MKKRNLILGVVCLSIIGLCSACNETNEDKVVAGIEIDLTTFKNKYELNNVKDLSGLKVNTLNASKKVVESIAYDSSNTKFSIVTDIDTSTIGTRDFEISYTATEGTFNAKASYTVTAASTAYTLSNWSKNNDYNNYETKFKSASDTPLQFSAGAPTNLTTFKKQSTFKIGNRNGFSLLPIIKAIDPADPLNPIEITELNSDMKVSLLDNTNTELTLSDYFSGQALADLNKKGIVDFDDDVVGQYTLRFRYQDGTKLSFKDIDYKLDVVSGYNITNAKELTAIDNSTAEFDVQKDPNKSFTNKIDISDFKKANNIPTEDFDNCIIQKDITINKEDLPECYIWQKGEPLSDSVVGSLKDWISLYGHFLKAGHETFNLYGNYNKISLGEEFPCVKTKNSNGKAEDEGTVVSAHTMLFSTAREYNVVNNNYKMTINDLESTGNAGVSSDETGKASGGILFFKPRNDSEINNCLIKKYFTVVVNDGNYQETDDGKGDVSPLVPLSVKLTSNDSRISDSYSSMFFNWSTADLEVKNTDLYSAGGALILNQCKNIYATDKTDPRVGSTVTIDNKSFIENWVAGNGGWFNLYNASSTVASLKAQLNPILGAFNRPFVNADDKINLLVVNMGTGEEMVMKPGLMGYTEIDGFKYCDYENGKDELSAALGAGDVTAFTKAIYETDYGSMFGIHSKGPAPIITSYDKVNNKKNLYYIDTTAPYLHSAGTPFGQSDTGSAIATDAGEYFNLYFTASKTANGVDLSSTEKAAASLASYQGSDSLGLVLGYAQ